MIQQLLPVLSYLHVLIAIALVLFVLLQDPKGGAMGVFSGGSSSNSFFGASGASNFLTTTTKWLAFLFAGSCLLLTFATSYRGSSVMDNVQSPPSAAPSATPAPNQQSIPGTNPALDNQAPAADTAPTVNDAPAPAAPKK